MKVTQRMVQQLLSECKFTSKDKILNLLKDISTAEYLEIRAIETIREARLDGANYHETIKRAMQLLILARIKHGTTLEIQEDEKNRA